MVDEVLTLVGDEIRKESTSFVEFQNGCWLSLVAEDGAYWGTTPYGTDWACNADTSAPLAIRAWVQYWNEARDESGDLF